MSAFYSYQQGTMHQANVYPGAGTGTACVLGNVINGVTVTAGNAEIVCGSAANNSTFNPLNAWTENTKDTNHVLGIKWEETIGKNRLQVGYQQSMGVPRSTTTTRRASASCRRSRRPRRSATAPTT